MADKIVSWGGIDSKGTSGMGVTGSLVVSGSVGIGTTTPSYNLEVSSTGYNGVGIMSGANSIGEVNFRNIGYPLPKWTIRSVGAPDGSSGNLTFQRLASTFPVTITSNENLLVGTTLDSARLAVKGSGTTSSTTALLVQNANASASFTVKDDRSATFAKEIYVDGDLGDGTGSIYLKNSAGDYSNRIGTYGYNTFISTRGTANGIQLLFGIGSGRALNFSGGDPNNIAISTANASLSINSVNDIVHGSDLIKIESRNYNGGEGVVITRGRSTNLTDPIVTFKYETAEKVRINNSGNVGIGTSTPSASLHISGSSSNALFEIDSPSQNNILYVSGSGAVGIGAPTSYALQVVNTSSLLVSATGWTPTVGSTASAAVSITPNIFATAGNRSYYSLYVGYPGITTSGSFGNYDQRSIYIAGKVDAPSGINAGDSRFYATSNAVSFQGYNPYNGQTGNAAGGITFTSRQVDGSNEAGIGAYYGAGSRLYIYNKYNASDSKIIFALAGTTIRAAFFGTGNLSIGNEETDMSARLGVKGSGTTSSTTALLVQNANSRTSFIVNDDGRVGINVAPYDSYALAVDPISGSTGVFVAQRAVANNTNEYRFVNSSGTPSAGYTAGSITWHTLSYLEGIYTLDTISGFRTVDLRIQGWSGSYAETIRFTYDNKVGIGTTSPSAKLHVAGNTIITGSLTVTGSLILSGSNVSTAWTSYTPTWTSDGTAPSLGNGTLTGAYKVIGKTCFVRVRLAYGSSTTSGTGAFYFDLPFSASAASGVQFPCSILDNGNAWYQATVNGEYGGFTNKTAIIGQSSGANSSQGITGVFPFTFGTSDSIQFAGSYEIA